MRFRAKEDRCWGAKRRTLTMGCLSLMLIIAPCAFAQETPGSTPSVEGVKQDSSGINIRLARGTLRVRPCMPNAARITYYTGATPPDLSNAFLSATGCESTSFTLQDDPKAVIIHMPDLMIKVDRTSGAVRFETIDGIELLRESDFPQPRQITPVVTDGEATESRSCVVCPDA